jgi:AraC-like DNA-binding protein
VVIYREMPPIWDASFRERFYMRWGRENAVISATTRRAEYPDFAQRLSIKMAGGGTEDYFVDGRRVGVDDETFLILNDGRRYGSLISSARPVRSFSIFFRPGLAAEVLTSLSRSTESELDDPFDDGKRQPEFDERLQEHDASVTPVLRHIQREIDAGYGDEVWLQEQLQFLIGRMLRLERRRRRAEELIPCAKPATRRELFRRIGLGVTFIHTHFRESIGLSDMARASHLSAFHFLRTFKAVYGVTPSKYLSRKRISVAARLMRESNWTLTEIAELVGFGDRTTLFRQLRAGAGTAADSSVLGRNGGCPLGPARHTADATTNPAPQ